MSQDEIFDLIPLDETSEMVFAMSICWTSESLKIEEMETVYACIVINDNLMTVAGYRTMRYWCNHHQSPHSYMTIVIASPQVKGYPDVWL